MKHLTIVALILGWSFSGLAQTVENDAFQTMLQDLLSHTVTEISVADVTETDDIFFIDAREKNEYKVSHIESAIWSGYDDFAPKRLKAIPKDAKVIVYCSVGYRSEKISEKMLEMGYTDVSNLYGGIFEWVNQKKPVVTVENEATDQVHAYDQDWGVWLQLGKKVY